MKVMGDQKSWLPIKAIRMPVDIDGNGDLEVVAARKLIMR